MVGTTGATQLTRDSLIKTGTALGARLTAGAMQHVMIAYNGSDLEQYVGMANVGTGTGEAGWSISELQYSDEKMIARKWANGSADFDKIWDSRATYSYR